MLIEDRNRDSTVSATVEFRKYSGGDFHFRVDLICGGCCASVADAIPVMLYGLELHEQIMSVPWRRISLAGERLALED